MLHFYVLGSLWQIARTLVEMSHVSTYWWRSAILFCRFCSSSPVSPSNLAIINKVTKPQRKCEDMFLSSLPARQARGRPLQPTESGNLRAANQAAVLWSAEYSLTFQAFQEGFSYFVLPEECQWSQISSTVQLIRGQNLPQVMYNLIFVCLTFETVTSSFWNVHWRSPCLGGTPL